ncbi:Nn.00g039900.m01.CDS01 [Neocucurbitaria sp. VM-36]
MAEPLGLALGVASLVLQLYKKCKNSSTDFHNLHLDLKSFHQTLVLTEHYLPRLEDIRTACGELVIEIEKLLSEHASRNPLRRVKVAYEDVQPLRMRLILQMSALHASVHMLKDHDCTSNPQSNTTSATSSQSLSAAVEYDAKTWKDSCQLTLPDIDFVQAIVLDDCLSRHLTLDATSCTTLFASSESLASNDAAQGRFSIQLLGSSSSISSAQTQRSLPPTHTEVRRDSWRSSIDKATDGIGSASTCNQWPQISKKELDNALIVASRTQEEVSSYHPEIVRSLLKQGASLECKDPECSRTPLIWAIVTGRVDLVELFLEDKLAIETRDGIWGWTPAIWAVMEDNLGVLEVLISNGVDLGAADSISKRTPLLWAASIGNYHAADAILRSNPELIDVTDMEGMTPLALAYFEGHLETARLFVESRDNSSFKFESGSSLLAWAILAKNEDFAQLLLEHGADAQGTNMDGVSALILAMKNNLPSTVELLLVHSAYVQCTDENAVPALTIAVKDQLLDIATLLVKNKADIDARDADGNTALLWAVWRNDSALVELLVRNKADVTVVDGEGTAVQKWATWTRNEDIIRLVSIPG